MRTFPIAIITGIVALAMMPLHAGHAGYCVTNSGQTTLTDHCCDAAPPITITAPDSTVYYLDLRADARAGPVWVYEETNGVDALQRGGTILSNDVWTPGYDSGPIDTAPVTAGPATVPAMHEDVVVPSTNVHEDGPFAACYDELPGVLTPDALIV